jgi:hypothetical protein
LREWNRDFEIFVQGLCLHIRGEQSQGISFICGSHSEDFVDEDDIIAPKTEEFDGLGKCFVKLTSGEQDSKCQILM